MNISPDNISGDCKLKCVYSFNYPISNCVATNKKNYISLSYDSASSPAVKFNNDNYNVSNILLVSPSLHKFNGSTVEAEFIIEHTPLAGGNALFVCIPVTSNSYSTKATTILQTIVSTVSNQAPASGETTNISIEDFTLNSIVPMEPFYSYSVLNNAQFIVYGLKNAINIDQKTMKSLQSMIQTTNSSSIPNGKLFSQTINSKTGKPLLLFVNSTGPTNGSFTGDGEIYIDCRPTGNSEETTNVTNVKPQTKMDLSASSIMQNPVVAFIIYSIFTIIILYVVYFLITYLSSGNYQIKMPSFSKNKSQ
jgi:hypothetical protein